MRQRKIAVTVTLLLVLISLGSADALIRERSLTGNALRAMLSSLQGAPQQERGEENNTQQQMPQIIPKMTGPDIRAFFAQRGFTEAALAERSLLSQIVPDPARVQGAVLLAGDDRMGAVLWLDSPDSKILFLALKEALLPSFSSELTDLRDEAIALPGSPVRAILSFRDPALSEERFAFVRVRERLYEFHIAAGKEERMQSLIEELTTQ